MSDNSKENKKPIPPGMENNDNFMEYAGLPRAGREGVRATAIEAPDLGMLKKVQAQNDAMREVIKTQLEVIKHEKDTNQHLRTCLHEIRDILLENIKVAADPAVTLSRIVRVITSTLAQPTAPADEVSDGESIIDSDPLTKH